MGRQPNFSELRDAIRQGQAKIAQGLKTGQMRSDRDKGSQQVPRIRLDPAHEVLGKKLTMTEKSALFERYKKPKFRFRLPSMPKIRLPQLSLAPLRPLLLGIGAILAVAVVVLVVLWAGRTLIGMIPERLPVEETAARQTADAPVAAPAPVETRPVQQPAQTPPVSSPPVETVRQPLPRTGDNVIVIQGITASRENELKSVQDFFAKHGIPTDILRRSNYSLLVTRQMFDNPARPGTTGYEIRMRIKTLGKQYPVETGDTKFGAEPFQDAYGMLK